MTYGKGKIVLLGFGRRIGPRRTPPIPSSSTRCTGPRPA